MSRPGLHAARARLARLTELAAETCACDRLRRAARATSRLYEAALAPVGLTATQFAILIAARRAGPIPLSRLAEVLVLDRTSLYRAVRPLARRGCLAVVAGRTRRERLARLTAAGQRLLDRALPRWEETQARVRGAFGPRAWKDLAGALAAVVPAIRTLESGVAAAQPRTRSRRLASP